MSIKAVIWDFGGVLMRTEDYSSRNRLAQSLGITRSEIEDLVFGLELGRRAQLGEISIDQHWENVRQSLGLSPTGLQEFRDRFWGGDLLDTDLIDYIRLLRLKYKTGLLSNAFSNLRLLVTDIWKIADAFDQMVVSAEVGVMKPDALIYQLAVESLQVAPDEAVFIDDFQRNIEGARVLKLQAIHFRDPVQAKGELETILKNSDEQNG